MVVKTYKARNTTEAMTQVKRDLGPEAVILRVKETRRPGLKGVFGGKLVLVTAAVDHPLDEVVQDVRPVTSREEPTGTPERAPALASELKTPACTAEGLVAILKEHDVEEGIARRIAAAAIRVERDSGSDSRRCLLDFAWGAIETLLRSGGPISPQSDRPRVVAMTGPTGVGKTTTVAKLAARFCREIGPQVAIVRTDHGPSGICFGQNWAGVAVENASSPGELRRCVTKHQDKQLILIDTAGRGPFDGFGLEQLTAMLSAVPEAEVTLAVSATAKARSLTEVAEAFSAVSPKRFVLTKIDETKCLGSILSLCTRWGIPLSYVTTGPRIPEDIEPADSRKLSQFILPGDAFPGSPQDRLFSIGDQS